MTFEVRFLGGAGTVTGSRFLVQVAGLTLLIDCGLFQGLKSLRLQNWQPLEFPAHSIDAVLLTHGHMDHCGYLPCLIRQGFHGPVYCSAPSREVAAIILRDSGKIQEEEAAQANIQGYSRHHPAAPLYTVREAERALNKLEAIEAGQWLSLFPEHDLRVRWRYNSHILGACAIELEFKHQRLVVSGDIGRDDDLLLYPPCKPERADWILMESTYGDRQHPHEDVATRLENLAHQVLTRGGSLLLPGFAIERTQTLLWLLLQLKQTGRLPDVPLLLDSPMGMAMLEVFEHFTDWHRLSRTQCQALTAQVHVIEHAQESQKWARRQEPKIVLAGSGMLSGGRILNYLVYELAQPLSAVVLTGFQAEGTRGRDLREGIPHLKIQGNFYPVRAQIEQLEGLSAHADQQGLIDWLSALESPPRELILVHGEPAAAAALQARLMAEKGWSVQIAQAGEQRKLS
jgi:metallo-beta-lactamase family protein